MVYPSNNRSSNISRQISRSNTITSNDIFSIFCSTSSIRGMQKIQKAQTSFLKVLWVGFVFVTTLLLLVTIVLLVKEYLGYYTAWHISTKLEDESLFPAITMCSHNPFSMKAKDLWSLKKIRTPTEFTNRLINLSLINLNEKTAQIFDTMVLRDEVQNYYTTLTINETIRLSHNEEFFQFCVVDVHHSKLVSRNCTADFSEYLNVLKFSHRNYFNCWTVEPKKSKEGEYQDISSLIIVASLIPSYLIPELKDSFVMDILERGEGLKMVLHETGTFPDIDKDGFNLQPGKLNEIAYEPIKWKSYSSPVKVCKDNQEKIKDLDRIFNYSFPQCVDAALQDSLLKECNCLSSLWPRPVNPNEKDPYCFNIWRGTLEEMTRTINCTLKFMKTMKARKQFVQMNQCFPRCNFFTYSTTLSITKWLSSIHKLDRIDKVQNQLELLFKNRGDEVIQNNYKKFLMTTYRKTGPTDTTDSLNEDRFTYIKLIRKNKNTTVKTEKLVLDVAILLSRIGGLCSLFIGLTVAFLIEIVEFIYLLVQMNESGLSSTKGLEEKITSSNVKHELPTDLHTSNNQIYNRNQPLKFNRSHFVDSLQICNYDSRIENDDDVKDLIWHQSSSTNYYNVNDSMPYLQSIVSEL